MTKKKPGKPVIPPFFLAAAIILFVSCAARQDQPRDSDPLIGQWKTNQNIFLIVHRLAGNELVAEIISAPGFFSTDLGAGHMLVRNIQPLPRRWYSGLFAMPGNEKPVKVQMRFMNRNAVVVETGDSRAQGNKMLWRRITNPSARNP